jgi:hypothetical protein
MATSAHKPKYPVKEDGPKREPVTFDIAEALESGEPHRRRPAEPAFKDDEACYDGA